MSSASPDKDSRDFDTVSPSRLHRFRTKVPCRSTPQSRALLDELKRKYSGSTVSFAPVATGRQAVMLTRRAGAEGKQIGWVEHCVQADPKLCNVRNQGLSVDTDGENMLVLRFLYPATSVRACSRRCMEEGEGDGERTLDFAEVRPALDLRPSDKSASPRLVWVTRPEAETINALQSRDYEAFYLRFKLEVQAGIWNSLTALLSTSPGSQWHGDTHYTVVREPDAAVRKIRQKTVDDRGQPADIGADRTYDAAPATDILLLYLEGDILADFADIYFTLQSLGSTDAYFLKEEFFTIIRRFWAGAQSLTSRYGSDLPAVVRMSQRAVPMPPQAPLLKQDWMSLRQSLVDRYGERGRKAPELVAPVPCRPCLGPNEWPFSTFPAGDVNVGLRLVYRQEWRHLGAERGKVLRKIPQLRQSLEIESRSPTPSHRNWDGARDLQRVETTIERTESTKNLDDILHEVGTAAVESMKWPRDLEGSIHIGIHALGSRTEMGLEAECRESSRDTSTRLTALTRRFVCKTGREIPEAISSELAEGVQPVSTSEIEECTDQDADTHVYSRLQDRFEVLTRLNEIENVVMIAEKLPGPAEIDLSWVRRHGWILGKALLDESFRETLEAIGLSGDEEIGAKRDRMYEHLRTNILHYQRAIWQQEDPQQRSMRYRKLGRKVPLEWRFELESGGALTIDELGERLLATNVDGHFATYTDGREADLDQVIDPAGPIGYYANFAIYHMRPEFGSDDLFSMLHFFKSPYLHSDPETGEIEVDDPRQIQLSEELGAASASCVFRRERTRRIAVDTGGVVIDVIRGRAALGGRDGSDDPRALVDSPDEYRLIFASARGIKVLSANGNRGAEADVAFHANARLRAGRRHDPEAEPMIMSQDDRSPRVGAIVTTGAAGAAEPETLALADTQPMLTVRAGRARDPDAPPVFLEALEAGAEVSGGTVDARGAAVFPSGSDEWRASVRAGAAHGSAASIVPRNEAERTLTAIAGTGPAQPLPRVTQSLGDVARNRTLQVGRLNDPENKRAVLARGEKSLSVTTIAGGGAAYAHERAIRARDHEWLRPSLFAG